ncbi:MAG: aspartyl protease family protein [Candidatus Acidiferrales bacterium]
MRAARHILGTLLSVCAATPLVAQSQPARDGDEIPLERCDRLPVVKVRIDGADYRFLVDTGATTFLNLKSFSSGKSKRITISSWSGTGSTSAREVMLPELALGSHRIEKLRVPAVDLSAIGEACGGQIDGILGVDLLEKLGATIDLHRRVARLGNVATPPRDSDEEARKHHAQMERLCLAAFNAADVKALEECLDPDVVLFTPWGESRGRKAMVDYVRERYFSLHPLPRMEMKVKSVRIIGSAAYYDYDYSITLPVGRIEGRGTGLCRRHGDRWLLLNMHNSRVEPSGPADLSSRP